jgi:hypothetical protein
MSPFRYISRDELAEAEAACERSWAQGGTLNLVDALLQVSMPARKKRSMLELRDLLFELAGDVEQGTETHAMLEKVIDRTDYLESIRKEDGSAVPDASKAGVLDE